MTTDKPLADSLPSAPPPVVGPPGPAFTIDASSAIPSAANPPEPPSDSPAPAPPTQAPPSEKVPATSAEHAPKDESVRANAAPEAPVAAPAPVAPASILTIDIGGTKVKILATGQTEPRKAPTGKDFTPSRLVETVRTLAHEWDYEAVTIGYPGLVGPHGPRSEPGNLGPGWVGFDFASAFNKPVKMVNDAAMQALGSYEGGRMLFLGLGTGLGSALITGHVVVPLELGRLPYDGERTFGEVLGRRGLARIGKGEWRRAVRKTVTFLMSAFVADYVVIGGGNAKNVKDLAPGSRLGHNLTAFRGGFRLWSIEDVWVLAASGGESPQPTTQEALRVL
jgi:polyphosphate glucokinase